MWYSYIESGHWPAASDERIEAFSIMKAEEITKKSRSPREYMRKVAEALVMMDNEGVVLSETQFKSFDRNERKHNTLHTNQKEIECTRKFVSGDLDPSSYCERNCNINGQPSVDFNAKSSSSLHNFQDNPQNGRFRNENIESSHGSTQGNLAENINEIDDQGPTDTILNEVFGITNDDLLLSYPSVERYHTNESGLGDKVHDWDDLMKL